MPKGLIIVLGLAVGVYILFKLRRLLSEPESNDDERTIHYSNPSNNHDHLKHMHPTRDSARAETRRMQSWGYEDSDRLVEYYNRERGGWFVGRSQNRY